ncbi:TPA: hypothetical protein ACGR36_004678 [Escherichia coli]
MKNSKKALPKGLSSPERCKPSISSTGHINACTTHVLRRSSRWLPAKAVWQGARCAVP